MIPRSDPPSSPPRNAARSASSRASCGSARSPLLAIAAAIFATISTGCFTITTSTETWPEPNVYGGTKKDWELVRTASQGGMCSGGPIGFVVGAIDLPLSAVADTLLLPANLVLVERAKRRESKASDAAHVDASGSESHACYPFADASHPESEDSESSVTPR